MAPDRHEASHKPQPLHRAGLMVALPGWSRAAASINEGAEYGQTETQTPQPLHAVGTTSAVVPLV